MKVKEIHDINNFFEVIKKCKGKIELVGPNIRLNLKSKMAEFVSLAEIFSANVDIDELEIVAYDYEDVMYLINYMAGRID